MDNVDVNSLPESPTLRQVLASGRFYYGAEVVTTRGIEAPASPGHLAEMGRSLLDDPRIGWVSITDNPGGTPMLPPDWLASLLASHRPRIVLHLTCKDMNRNGLEAAAWRSAAEGFDNILAITGDYPTAGFGGIADGVFDLDSVGLISLLRSMNDGLKVPGRCGEIQVLPKTNFFIGCVVSPFKRHERELVPQYLKLLRKIRVGAQWVIPQLGYDMRKFHEVKLWLTARGVDVPVIGNVYLLNRAVAQLFNSGKLAGCVVSDEFMETIRAAAAGPDKGKRFFRELAAKQLAVFKGLGFAAGYLGGITKAETFGEIIDLAESYGESDWRDFLKEIRYSQPDEFFFFEHDPQTGASAGPDQSRVPRVAQASAEVEAGYSGLPRLPRRTRVGVHAWQRAVRPVDPALCTLGQEAWLSEPVFVLVGEGGQAPWLRLSGLRRLQLARLRLSLPDGPLLQAFAERALRRVGRRSVRAVGQRLFLGSRLRTIEALR